ncbi:AaceriAGR340Wp [[Ashbya] aceris (nom. inval.)]|nr:AaceriAGR340Wp [[Ashbya] aceris (nom. inval.)]
MSINLEHILGFKVRVTNVLDGVTQGKIYAYDSGNHTLTLLCGRKGHAASFKVIKTTFIKSLEVVGEKPASPGIKRDTLKPAGVNIERVVATLRTRDAEHRVQDSGGGAATAEGRAVFESVARTVAMTRWEGDRIVVLDEVEIAPPYTVAEVRGAAASCELVAKIVEGTWRKLESQKKGG